VRLKTRTELAAEKEAKQRARQTHYDTSKLAIVYVRQSGSNAPTENKESRYAQLDDLQILAMDDYSWPQERIVTIDENTLDKRGNTLDRPRGVSGRYGSDTRAGLRILEARIELGEVGAIFIREASRLFRDVERDSAPSFTKLCKAHGVVIVTPYAQYDVTKPDGYNSFLDATQAAGKELATLYQRMHAGKERKGKRGEYAGCTIAAGYTLSGDDYIPLPTWAEVITYLARRYRELDGSLSELFSEIRGQAVFPELPPGVRQYVPLKKVPNGYTISSSQSLAKILTNPVYAGHRTYQQNIVRRNAHEPLIDSETYAFILALLGQVDLDGIEIEREPRVKRFTHQYTKRDGLLAGVRSDGTPVLTSSSGSVYVFQSYRGYTGYSIKNNKSLATNQVSGSIAVDDVDGAVSQRLEEKLSQLTWHAQVEKDLGGNPEYGSQAILNHMSKLKEQSSRGTAKLDEAVRDCERAINKRLRDYEIAGDVMSTEDVREHYASLARLRGRLTDLQEKLRQANEADADIASVATNLNRAAQEWKSFTLEQKRAFVRLITASITLDVADGRWMKLAIEWHPVLAGEPLVETAIFMKSYGANSNYTQQEDEVLRKMY